MKASVCSADEAFLIIPHTCQAACFFTLFNSRLSSLLWSEGFRLVFCCFVFLSKLFLKLRGNGGILEREIGGIFMVRLAVVAEVMMMMMIIESTKKCFTFR